MCGTQNPRSGSRVLEAGCAGSFISVTMQHADPRGWRRDAVTGRRGRRGRLGKGGWESGAGGELGRTGQDGGGDTVFAGGAGGSAALAPQISGVKRIKGVCEGGCAGTGTRPAQSGVTVGV